MEKEISNHIKEFLERDSSKRFLEAANSFVKLLELKNIGLDKFLPQLHLSLLELYKAGHNLDIIELKSSTDERDFEREELFVDINTHLISELGVDCFYWEVLDPTYTEKNGKPDSGWEITDKEATQGWLVDDLADIYRDLKVELIKIEEIGTEEAIEDAFWTFKWSFTHHWGKHCIDALRYLHYLYYEGKVSL